MHASSLDFARMFALSNAFTRGALHFAPVGEIGSPETFLRGLQGPRTPAEFKVASGRRRTDLVGTTYVSILLVSDRFVGALQDHGFAGWSTYDVLLRDKTGGEITGYSGLAIHGAAGPISREKSRIVFQPPAVPTGKLTFAELGLYFDEASWDRSDLFVPQSSSVVCVVERVKEAIESRQLTNISFKALSDYQMALHGVPPPSRTMIR